MRGLAKSVFAVAFQCYLVSIIIKKVNAMRMTNMISSVSLALAIAGTSLMSGVAPATAHDAYYRDAASAECEAPGVMRHISRRFAHQAKHVHQRPDWRIDTINEVHQHRYLPQDAHKARPIPRRYCHATAHLNDGSQRKIWFLIEGGMGFAGFGRNEVEFCLDGLDPQNVYNSNCGILR